ncbi:hypothetical protein M422DRAFT_245137 [Sphaerobolus stellatus SS14]|nr:hypothetical protein M422DRAFT_245137 [Sphaerobolus stellatus SS14]
MVKHGTFSSDDAPGEPDEVNNTQSTIIVPTITPTAALIIVPATNPNAVLNNVPSTNPAIISTTAPTPSTFRAIAATTVPHKPAANDSAKTLNNAGNFLYIQL